MGYNSQQMLMAKTIKQVILPTAEKLRNFTRLGEQKRGELLEGLKRGKVVAGPYVSGDRVVTFGGVTVVLNFTGAGFVPVKVTGLGHPQVVDPDRAVWKTALDRLSADGYTAKRVATTDAVILELTDKKDPNLRVTIFG